MHTHAQHTPCVGGCLDASEELRAFARAVGAPITQTLMGLGSFPTDDPQSMQMLGMHGTVYANYAIDQVCSLCGRVLSPRAAHAQHMLAMLSRDFVVRLRAHTVSGQLQSLGAHG
eukprot:1158344-Pelagomonas_calceolata.AAC.8